MHDDAPCMFIVAPRQAAVGGALGVQAQACGGKALPGVAPPRLDQ